MADQLTPIGDIPNGSTRGILLYTGATGQTVAVTISKNGAAFTNPSGGATNATEIAGGWYIFTPSATDTGTDGPLLVKGNGGGNLAYAWGTVVNSIPTAQAGTANGLHILGANTGDTSYTGSVGPAVAYTGASGQLGMSITGGGTGGGLSIKSGTGANAGNAVLLQGQGTFVTQSVLKIATTLGSAIAVDISTTSGRAVQIVSTSSGAVVISAASAGIGGVDITNSGGNAVFLNGTGGSSNGLYIQGSLNGIYGSGGTGDGLNYSSVNVAGRFAVGGALTVSGATTLTGAVTATNASNNVSLGAAVTITPPLPGRLR